MAKNLQFKTPPHLDLSYSKPIIPEQYIVVIHS